MGYRFFAQGPKPSTSVRSRTAIVKILVPGDEPVCGWGFVESDCADREWFIFAMRLNEVEDPGRAGEISDVLIGQQRAFSGIGHGADFLNELSHSSGSKTPGIISKPSRGMLI